MVNWKGKFQPRSQLFAAIQPLATVQALGPAVVRWQRVQGLQFGRGEEGVMAFYHQVPLPLSVDTQDLQLRILNGHVGGARGVHTQNLRGGYALRAAVFKGIALFCREEKTYN